MPDHERLSVLLIEHSSENLGWVEEHLLGVDLDLYWASSGGEALELARENDFGMVLLGIEASEDSMQTAALLRSDPLTRQLPILFLGQGALEETLPLKEIGTGIVDYLPKSFDPVILQNRVRLFRELFDQRKAIEWHVDEIRKTHGQLEKSKERYRRLLESVTSYVYTVELRDGEPVSTVHGRGCESLTGYSPEEYAADPSLWIRMIPDEDRPAVINAAKRILDEALPVTVEHRIHHKDGYIHWVRNTLVPHFHHDGALINYDGIIIDITERKHAERKLAKSVSLLEATLESTADGILVVDADGSITRYNKKILDLWRIPAALAARKDDFELLEFMAGQLKHPGVFIEKVSQVDSHPETESFDLLEFEDGRIFERYSKPQRMGSETVGRVWSFRDISDRRNLEEQLRQAQKMEAIGQLAGGIAHDFNNILTVILGYGTQLQDAVSEDDPSREPINQVLAAAERAANLTRSLLLFSRKQVMTPSALDVNELVCNMEKFLKRIIGEDIQLQTNYSADLPKVYADSGQLEQVVMNLAANARDAMPNGGILAIETQLQELDEEFVQTFHYGVPGRYVLLSVSDSGCGMDQAVCKKIFEPFFSTKEVGKGTGLGLSVVYGIVRQHEGYIHVYSETGLGTTFKILIPCYTGELHEDTRKLASFPVGGAETILVAEDDPDISKLTASCLQGIGYNVILAKDGAEALKKYRANRHVITLSILDMLMPKIGGREVGRQIKRLRPDARILFMSGYSLDLLQSKGLCESGTQILMKPYRPYELAVKVREILDSPL